MLGCGLDLDLNIDLHNHSVFEVDFNYELDLDFDVCHDLDIDFNLVNNYDLQPDIDLDWKSSLSRELSTVSVQVREPVPGWGGRMGGGSVQLKIRISSSLSLSKCKKHQLETKK